MPVSAESSKGCTSFLPIHKASCWPLHWWHDVTQCDVIQCVQPVAGTPGAICTGPVMPVKGLEYSVVWTMRRLLPPSERQTEHPPLPNTTLGCGWHGALFCWPLPVLSEDHSKARLCSKSGLLDKPPRLLSCGAQWNQWDCKCYLEALPSPVGNHRALACLALGQGHALCLDYNTLEKQLLACNGALIRDWLQNTNSCVPSIRLSSNLQSAEMNTYSSTPLSN